MRTIVIKRNELERSVEIYIPDPYVDIGSTNYDESGWAGLELLENVARNIAEAFNLDIEEIDGDYD